MAVAMQTEDFPYLPSGPAEVNKMIKEHGDLFSDSQCNVCSAVLISESQKLSHYQSKKHANKVRRYLSIQNEEPALKKFKSSSDASPYQGNVHAKNPRLKPAGPQTPAASQTPPTAQPQKRPAEDSSSVPTTGNNNSIDDNNNPDRFCSICQASFNNPLMAQQHYVGKKHRKRMVKLKLMETYSPSTAPVSTLKGYPCTVCNIDLNSLEQYQSHISGAKHKNQVKKSRLNTAVNQEAAEQPQEGNDQYAAPVDQYAAPVDQYAAPVDQYAAPVDQYAAPVDQYAAPVDQYAPEDTQYSEEYQFT